MAPKAKWMPQAAPEAMPVPVQQTAPEAMPVQQTAPAAMPEPVRQTAHPWLEKLCVGPNRFEAINMLTYGERVPKPPEPCGWWLVRRSLTDEECEAALMTFEPCMQAIDQNWGATFRRVGARDPCCCCKYNYMRTTKHPLFASSPKPAIGHKVQPQAVTDAVQWALKTFDSWRTNFVPDNMKANLVLVNEYSVEKGQVIPWHTDDMEQAVKSKDDLQVTVVPVIHTRPVSSAAVGSHSK